MIRHVESFVNHVLRVNYCNPYLKFRSVSYRNVISLKTSFIHVPVRDVSLVPRVLTNIMICNKWSKKNSPLIERSPVNYQYLYCHGVVKRYYTTRGTGRSRSNRSTLVYSTAVAIVVLGLSYAAVPLYRMFCQVNNTV